MVAGPFEHGALDGVVAAVCGEALVHSAEQEDELLADPEAQDGVEGDVLAVLLGGLPGLGFL